MNNFPKELNNGEHILVFGSNAGGRHGKGAALTARLDWGAIYGQGEGRQGNAYGIPTKGAKLEILPLNSIQISVARFLEYARKNPTLKFCVTKIGCGLAGYSENEIAPMFQGAPENCILPDGWR